jgi:two-component system chemotaxis response regulator CheY
MRIMIVDDDARMRQALTRLLQNAGFQSVEQASDGQEALDRVVSAVTHVDLIITDCAMPRLDGLAFVRALRTRGDHTPVIMISGEHNPDLVIQAIKAGVNNYVPKPIHVQSLIEKIWQTLGVCGAGFQPA